MRSATSIELRAIATLLERGHKVAVPVVDDDGVDLVIDYGIRANVKSCRAATDNNRWTFECKATKRKVRVPVNVHFYILYAHDADAWWIVPAAEVASADGTIRRVRIAAGGAHDAGWRDAWHLLRQGA